MTRRAPRASMGHAAGAAEPVRCAGRAPRASADRVPVEALPAPTAPGVSPPADPARGQPLLAALLITILWANGLRALDALLLPGAWSGWSLLIAALTLATAGIVRTIRPVRILGAVVLSLLVGAIPTGLAIGSATGLETWWASPGEQLRAAGLAVHQGVAPLEATPTLSAVIALVSLLFSWACVLMSAGSGDAVGVSGFVPAGALLVPGLVVGQIPPTRSVLVAGACLVLLVGSAAPAAPGRADLPRATRLRRAVVRACGRALVIASALGLAAGAVHLAPIFPDRPWGQVPGRPATVPETTLTLNRDLVRGSSATAFEHSDAGFPEGASLRLTLAVVRDLDGPSWSPLAEAEGLAPLSDPASPAGTGALTAGGAVAADGTAADVEDPASYERLPRVRVRVRDLSGRRLPLLQSTALVAMDGADDASSGSPDSAGRAPTAADWWWVAGTGTVISTGAPTQPDTGFTAYGWSSVADSTGLPRLAPPASAAAPSPGTLAPYTSVPEGSRVVRDAAEEAIGASGATGSDNATRAAALAAWFHGNGFVYDESAPGGFDGGADGASGGGGASGAAPGSGASRSPTATVEAFLTERRGYCIHYAAAFTLMARGLGIPTRIAIGYASQAATSGDAPTAVSGRDLHAWPEVWIDDVGWVAFEPTPGGAGARADAAPTEETSAPPGGAQAGTTPPAPPSPSTAPRGDDSSGSVGGSAAEGDGARPSPPAVAALAAGVLAAACPGGLRWHQRRRRRREVAVGDAPACAAWEEVLATAVDLGLLGRRSDGPRMIDDGGPRMAGGSRSRMTSGTRSPGGAGAPSPGGDGRRSDPRGGRPRALTPEAIAEYLSGLIAARGRETVPESSGAARQDSEAPPDPGSPPDGGGGRPDGSSPQPAEPRPLPQPAEPRPPSSAWSPAEALGVLAAQVVAERFSLSAELPGRVGEKRRVGRTFSRSRNDIDADLGRLRVTLATCVPRRRRLIALLAPNSVMPHRWRA